MKKIRKIAFTLSEVLITLVIIGVVTAITIPVLYADFKKEELKTGFTKAFSDLDNFAHKFRYDYGLSFSEYAYEHTVDENYKAMQQYIYKAYKNPISVTDDENYKLKTLNGKDAFPHCDTKGLFVGPGGTFWGMTKSADKLENGSVICVDINGAKGPNRYGKDFFLFLFTLDGRAIPMGMEYVNNTDKEAADNFFHKGAEHCNKNADNSFYNTSCAYFALMDKHPTKPGKSYWKDFI